MIYGAIPAGGCSARMGGDLPKQFMELDGVPMLVRTVRALAEQADVVAVGAPAAHLERTRALLAEYGLTARVMAGGATRQETLLNLCLGLRAQGAGDDDVILSHDAARPYVTPEIIAENLRLIAGCDCVTTALAATDTVLRRDDSGVICGVIPRQTVLLAQTPQTFRLGDYIDLYQALDDEKKARLTDASALFLQAGKRVLAAAGSPRNVKITTMEDLRTN